MIKKLTLSVLFAFLGIGVLFAQKFAIKTNVLQWATTTPNIAAEVAFAPRWTFALSGANNPWVFSDNKKLKHWLIEPEVRFWLWEPMNGHFFGIGGQYGQYNVGGIKMPFGIAPDLENYRYQGDMYGIGITYGYQWMLSSRWGLEGSVGLGYQHHSYHKYQCRNCGLPVGPDGTPVGEAPLLTKNYFGPTKAALSLIFIIR